MLENCLRLSKSRKVFLFLGEYLEACTIPTHTLNGTTSGTHIWIWWHLLLDSHVFIYLNLSLASGRLLDIIQTQIK
jgi:hypothetical protein